MSGRLNKRDTDETDEEKGGSWVHHTLQQWATPPLGLIHIHNTHANIPDEYTTHTRMHTNSYDIHSSI